MKHRDGMSWIPCRTSLLMIMVARANGRLVVILCCMSNLDSVPSAIMSFLSHRLLRAFHENAGVT